MRSEDARPPTITTTAWPPELVQAMIDALSASVVVIDPGGEIVAVNAAWERFAREGGGDAATCGLGSNYLRICDEAVGPCSDEAPEMASGIREVLRGLRDEFRLDYPCHSPTEQRWFRAVVRGARVPGAAHPYAVIVHEDITERQLARLRESDLTHEVELAVGERTLALREANDDLDLFAASVSHDLRAPVRQIQGFLDLLRRRMNKSGLANGEQALLDRLQLASARLSVMIDGLLALARVSRQELVFDAVDMNRVVAQAWMNTSPDRLDRDISWRHDPLPPVRGDLGLLVLAFENLLSNAVKYTAPRTQAHIDLRVQDGGTHWVFELHDDGVGFDPSYAEKLFTAFSRLHRESEFQGVGMGLANVKRIVTRHGGEVWARGHAGDGASFFVSLPKA